VTSPCTPALLKINGRILAADNIRFWCMFSIVALHGLAVFSLLPLQTSAFSDALATLFKFATIGFFLISGLLLQHDLERLSSLALLSKRIRKVLLPWTFWCALFIAFLTATNHAEHRGPFEHGTSFAAGLLHEAIRGLTTTSLWFVPNLLIGLAILLLFRRHLESLRLGAVLLAANLFYTVNVYAHWVAPDHPRALFAFVIYLWLGRFAATRLPQLAMLLERISTPLLLSATLLAAAAAFAEAQLLHHLHSTDALNTLRPTNQLFSILVVLCIAKLRRSTWPGFVDIPRHIFGIYLSHALLVSIVISLIRRMLELPAFAALQASVPLRFTLWIAATCITWTSGFLLSRSIAASPRLCWMQGLTPPPRAVEVPSRELPEGAALFIG
jgi:surface polysaccharide O-acyltransferase-like enzyme